MPAMVFYNRDIYSPVMFNSRSLTVSEEQNLLIDEVLRVCCSDSRFAQKAKAAVTHILTAGSTPAPVVNSLSPSGAVLGAASFVLHVMGTGFDALSAIIWNGSAEPTSYVSATELTTIVDMSSASVAAEIPVMVQVGSGVLSNAMTFSITGGTPLAASASRSGSVSLPKATPATIPSVK